MSIGVEVGELIRLGNQRLTVFCLKMSLSDIKKYILFINLCG